MDHYRHTSTLNPSVGRDTITRHRIGILSKNHAPMASIDGEPTESSKAEWSITRAASATRV
jgi:hypothetical protein